MKDAPPAPDTASTPKPQGAAIAAEPATRQPIPQGPAPHVALILPVSSPALGRLADAVRQGFLAAAEVAGKNALPYRVYATADDGPAVLESCRKAQPDGAVLVLAGLTRDGATGLAKSDCPRQPTLVLNQPQDHELPAKMYSISLSAEQDARQAALMAINDGWRSAIVIASPSPLARRVHEAFEREWGRAAGEVRRLIFSGVPEEAPAIKERIATMNGDMVFLALDQAATLAVRPYISGTLPIYTTSLGVDPRADATVNVDLEGVRYMDMPWFVQPDHAAVMIYPQPKNPMAVEQERLYALGIDAYRLCALLLQSDAKSFSLDGVTGRITAGRRPALHPHARSRGFRRRPRRPAARRAMTPGTRESARHRGEEAEELAARLPRGKWPGRGGPQLPHAVRRDRPRRARRRHAGVRGGARPDVDRIWRSRRERGREKAAAHRRRRPTLPGALERNPPADSMSLRCRGHMASRRGFAAPSKPPRPTMPTPGNNADIETMDHTAHLRSHFQEGIELKQRMSETMAPAIARAGVALAAPFGAATRSSRAATAARRPIASISRRSWSAASSASVRACRPSRSPSTAPPSPPSPTTIPTTPCSRSRSRRSGRAGRRAARDLHLRQLAQRDRGHEGRPGPRHDGHRPHRPRRRRDGEDARPRRPPPQRRPPAHDAHPGSAHPRPALPVRHRSTTSSTEKPNEPQAPPRRRPRCLDPHSCRAVSPAPSSAPAPSP